MTPCCNKECPIREKCGRWFHGIVTQFYMAARFECSYLINKETISCEYYVPLVEVEK